MLLPLPGSRPLGFTLPELVMTIVIIAILGALVAPRFMASGAFESRGFYDEAKAVMRYAQKIAVARRRTVMVCIEADRVFAISNADCAAPTFLTHPLNPANPLRALARAGVTLTPTPGASFTFDGLGRSSGGVTSITLNSTVTGDPARTITVAAETGYVR